MASPVVVSRIQNRRGTQSQFDMLYPPGYYGVGGYGSIAGFTPVAYPNVLAPGELALCTDSRKVIVGNLNGEYVTLLTGATAGIELIPVTVELSPGTANISALTYSTTNFFTILYDIADVAGAGRPGVNFSRNGEMKITCLAPPGPANLVDSSSSINLNPTYNINFFAQYNTANTMIEIHYQHNFPTSLYLSTSTIRWI